MIERFYREQVSRPKLRRLFEAIRRELPSEVSARAGGSTDRAGAAVVLAGQSRSLRAICGLLRWDGRGAHGQVDCKR